LNTLLEVGLGSAERLLGARFLIALLLPVLLATGASTLVGLAATENTPGEALAAWQVYSASGQLMIALWAGVGLIGVAYVLAFFHFPMLRLLEGDWPQKGLLGSMRRVRVRHHQGKAAAGWERVEELSGKAERTDSSALAARLLVAYPPPTRLLGGVLPTAFGNRLRAAEYYPLERYGIDSVVIWPRLRPLLPTEASDRLTAARTALDGSVSLLGLCIAFGTVWPFVLLVAGGHNALAALCLGALPLSWIAYNAALHAAASYGQEVRVVFDLHRSLVLRQLEVDIPQDAATERRVWDDLSQFYLRNLPFVRQCSTTPQLPPVCSTSEATPTQHPH
jgi:hypothetical protein